MAGGKLVMAQEHFGHWTVRVALCISLFVFEYSPSWYCYCYCLLQLLFC